MKLLFNHKYKTISGWIFYLTIPIALYAFITSKFDDFLVVKVYPLFSFRKTISTAGTENVIGSDGFQWIGNGLVNEILISVIIIAGIINSFSKERYEDELIGKLSTESLTLSLYVNYGILLLANFLIYELTFIYVLVFNLIGILLFFNLIFKYRLYKHYKG
ncbi:hypothetical protein [Portibacter marinus]|uniref:hypothetical protein n=1 Tax=Portibacter marinus TaxID=2898660 RepID=UPI001F3D5864|nr:hypothetical protein [Portibacter marinus]